MDMREQEKEVILPGASGGGGGGVYGHIFGETSSERRVDSSIHNGSSHHHIQTDHHDGGGERGVAATTGENVGGGGAGGGGGGGGGGNGGNFTSGGRSKARGVRYRECLKNHAASVGGNIYDGCGEFMQSGEDGTLEALKCAACECHRNFHRKEIDGETQLNISPSYRRGGLMLNHLQLPPPLPSPSALHAHHHHKFSAMALNLHSSPTAPIIAPMNVAFASGNCGGGGTESSSEDLNVFHSNAEVMISPSSYSLSKKRFRTKFTQDQKDRMLEFAEKVGWRIQKQDEEEVERFCSEVGVKRQVLKVWMHNNKNTMKKPNEDHEPDQLPGAIAVAGVSVGVGVGVTSES